MVFGFIILIKGADLLVKGSSSIARIFKVSDLVIGLTVVAFGTSSAELFVNIIGSIKGHTEIVIGNVIGSNIANIFLVLGISSIILPLSVRKSTVWKGIPLCLLASVLLGILANDSFIDKAGFSALTRIDGFVFILFFIIFLYYSIGVAKEIEGMEDHVPLKKHGVMKSVLLVFIGLTGLILGREWIVNGAEHIAKTYKVSQSFIGLTIVSLGTSLPELATSAMAAYKKQST